MSDQISERLLDQRLRNRIMEALWNLADGDDYVSRMGRDEYFCAFFDFMSMDDQPYPNSAMSPDEARALEDVCTLMNTAADATPKTLTWRQLIASGWPRRIQPHAEQALAIFLERGRFDEAVEQDAPSFAEGQAWRYGTTGKST